jgi:hypothetical protein
MAGWLAARQAGNVDMTTAHRRISDFSSSLAIGHTSLRKVCSLNRMIDDGTSL